MKTVITLVLVSLTLLFSCSETPVAEPKADTLAEFAVSGMTCKMGCGATLRKGLLETGAVTQVDVDFDENNAENTIAVHFDETMTDEKALLAVIEKLNDNQFTARFIAKKKLTTSNADLKESSSATFLKDRTTVQSATSFFALPNFSKLLNGLFF